MNNPSLVPDDLWEAIESLLPKEPPKPRGGRPRIPDRAALGGIIYVLRTGCPWWLLPMDLGCSSGVTCWRRLRDWQEAGVWEKLHTKLLNGLGHEAAVDWSRASVDSISVRAKRRAKRPAPTRRIVARRGPRTIWPSTGTASPWPSAFRPPTPTTPPISSTCRCGSTHRGAAGVSRSTPQAPREAARRQGLRLLDASPCPACSPYHSPHCPPRDRIQRAAGATPLGRGAHLRLAAWLPPARR